MSSLSISQKLHIDLERLINNTEPGQRLPTEPDLALQLGVSRATLREAMRTFEVQGLLRRRQGSGTYVTHPTHIIESGLEILESIQKMANRVGLTVSLGVWKTEIKSSSQEDRKLFNLNADNELVQVSRVILAENRPVAYLIDILPLEVLRPSELETGFTGSVLDLLLKRGIPDLSVSRTEINAVTASKELAFSLGIQRRVPLLCFTADLYTTDGIVIDHSISYFLPGYFNFHVVRRVGKN